MRGHAIARGRGSYGSTNLRWTPARSRDRVPRTRPPKRKHSSIWAMIEPRQTVLCIGDHAPRRKVRASPARVMPS